MLRVDIVLDDLGSKALTEGSESVYRFKQFAIQPLSVEASESGDNLFVSAITQTGKNSVKKNAIFSKQQAALENSDHH